MSNFKKIPFIGIRVVPCGHTDSHDEANSRFSQFCERAYKPATRREIVLKSTVTCGISYYTDLQSKISIDEISLLWLFRGC